MKWVPARWTLLGLAGRHFRWRSRGAAAFLARAAAAELARPWRGLVCGSMLNLAELRGLAPALAATPALVVFHENQIAYPAPGRADARQQGRDLYLAFSDLTTALAADRVVFNSRFNRDQVLSGARELKAMLPDAWPPGLVENITAKSTVLPIPLQTDAAPAEPAPRRQGPLRMLWNHRWHQDKDPEAFFAVLFALADQGAAFEVAVLGQRAGAWPAVFDQAAARLGSRLVHLGPASRADYWRILAWADVVVSTARQEYFGLAVAEAIWAGCRPLVPKALVYPELYPAEFCYPLGGLAQALAPMLTDPQAVRGQGYRLLVERYTWQKQAAPWRRCIYSLWKEET